MTPPSSARLRPRPFSKRLLWSLVFLLGAFGLSGCSQLAGGLDNVESVSPWLVGPLIALATLTSEDLTCVTAGVLASEGTITFAAAVFWCWIGILGGDIGLYLIGRFLGERAGKLKILRLVLSPKRLKRGEHLFNEHGGWVLFTSRFLPGTRVPAYVAAGVVRYSLWKFSLFLALAGGLWTPVIVWLAKEWGEAVQEWMSGYEKYIWPALIGAIIVAWLAIEFIVPLLSHKGRRRLLGRWRRFTEWEFWPMWRFYPPVVLYILWLGIKHRGLTVFTAANPAIPHSGMALESKSQILTGLAGEKAMEPRIARWTLIHAAEEPARRLEKLTTWMEAENLSYPIVLKPDIGERGQGVGIVRGELTALRFLLDCRGDLIAQEYVDGLEFGVFYWRMPGAERGEIFSINRKQLTSVTGNGKHNLERLILDDPRAMRMAKFFLRKHEDRIDWIPDDGEHVTLTEVGTHCRGALFTDARDLLTEPLLDAIDDLTRQFDGFYFGRYDLRVPSIEALQEGRDFKVLELNGVSAEATHIYQPGFNLLRAYRDLARQWRIAFEIGAANVKNGAKTTSILEFWRLLRQHSKTTWFEAPVSQGD
tara:strand:+ start:22463 stop:24235 length:1773 start_codon:yes stop_codon:yes gene_type:complete